MIPMRDGNTACDDREAPEAGEGSRALVVVERRSRSLDFRMGARPAADFVTQLLACEERLPEFRRWRQAEPGTALARYRGEARRPSIRARFQRVL